MGLVCKDRQGGGGGDEEESAIAAFRFLIKRLIQALLVMLVIALIGFAIQEALGDPLRSLVGQNVSDAEREALRDRMGLNDPWYWQFMAFLGKAAQGDLGTSYFLKKPALEVILARFPATFELVLASTVIILLLCFPAGFYCALRPQSLLTRLILGASIVGISIPVFLTGILLITVFSVELGWLPSFGRGDTVNVWGWETGFLTRDGLVHLILPAITLASIMLPLFVRLIRTQMIEALSSEYVRYAYAKGLRPMRIWLVHAFKNAALPVITVGGLQIGTMIAYTILTETVFQWPGMGFLFLEAVNRADTPLIIAYIIVVGLIFVVTNTLVDLIYVLADPRVSAVGPAD